MPSFKRLIQIWLASTSYVLAFVYWLVSFGSRIMTGKGNIVPSPKVINPQLASPLFNRLPPEVRNMIFRFALTAYEDPARKYERQAYYYRPGYTCPRKIDIDLLLTCRLVHAETASLPASINEHLSWYWRGPPEAKRNGLPSDSSPGSSLRRRELRSIHIFAQQYWLEQSFAGFTQFWNISCPTHLKITIRHTDWWWWEDQAPLALDPKREDRPLAHIHSSPSDPFEPQSWGAQFRKIRGLQNLQLELETVKSKRPELDAIVTRAPGWKFALGDDQILVLDESKTQRRGWVGQSPCKFPSARTLVLSFLFQQLGMTRMGAIPIAISIVRKKTKKTRKKKFTSPKA